MAVSYNGLWKLLIDKNMNKTALMNEVGISSSTIAKMSKGEGVSIAILEKLCDKLECENPFPARAKNSFKINSLRDTWEIPDNQYVLPADLYGRSRKAIRDKVDVLYTTEDFVYRYNPYIRHIVRRTRNYLENTLNLATEKTYLKKIDVELLGEKDKDGIIDKIPFSESGL